MILNILEDYMTLKEQFYSDTGIDDYPLTYENDSGEFVIDERYYNWLETKLQNTSSNSDYAKCKSIGCQFYDKKFEFSCCANESLCEKCMNSQHLA